MQRLAVAIGLVALLVLPACQMWEQRRSPEQAEVQTQQQDQAVAQQRQQELEREQQRGQTRESAEFMGQAPKVEDAPETVVLEAKNGNVTLSHRKHAGMMDCAKCHGAGTPGKMAEFNKDKAHALCMGCHKEKAAGPTKCQECHKKS